MKVQLGDICTKASSNIAQKDLEYCEGNYPIYGASGLIKYVNFYHQKNPYIAVVKDGAGVGRVMSLPGKSSVIGTLQYIIPNDGVDVSYLAYAIEHMNLAKYYSGATIPHIYFKDYCKERLQFHNSEDQRRIAAILDKVSELISLRKQQLDKLDEAVKARFVEMFGDETQFEAVPLKNNVEEMFIGPFGSSLKNECFVSKDEGYCIVYEQKHAIRKTMDIETRYVDRKKYAELKRFSVLGGDIIVSCRGTIGEVYAVPDNAPLGIMHPSIMKIRLKESVYNKRYFVFALEQYMQNYSDKANGSGVKMAVTATALGKEKFVVPPMPVQQQFAAFVEQIDKSELTIQQSLDKLEVLKKSLMQEYFG